MDILIIGLGVIGTTYGSVFKEAGHNVEHYIREGSNKKTVVSSGVYSHRACIIKSPYPTA